MADDLKRLFEGKWQVFKSENFEKFLDKNDVGFIKKKAAMTLTPTLTVSVEGETITSTLVLGPKTTKTTFTLGTEFESDGDVPSKVVASFSGGKWVMKTTPKDPKKGKPQEITREIEDGNLVQTMVVEDVTCKRFFKRV